ncbi:DUF1361 domain-containing protein [Alginatibacterium sediminis]|nr:DUF1361 domain-containing protein [Alginatibacterium sediminis]
MSTTPVHFTVVTNLVLALLPLVLAIYLFKISHKRSVSWWILLPVFIALLPNSAYVLTDIIHFIAALRSPTMTPIHLIFITTPFYLVFLSLCFEFYVLSVRFGQQYLENINPKSRAIKWLSIIFPTMMHLLSAIGVYLGRFQRLESSDIIHQPIIVFKDLLLDLSNGSSSLIILGLFSLFAVLYYIFEKTNCKIYALFTYHKAINPEHNPA